MYLKHVFVREEVYSSSYGLGDYEARDSTIRLKYRAQLDVRFRPSGS